jgi:hypothetical protein
MCFSLNLWSQDYLSPQYPLAFLYSEPISAHWYFYFLNIVAKTYGHVYFTSHYKIQKKQKE